MSVTRSSSVSPQRTSSSSEASFRLSRSNSPKSVIRGHSQADIIQYINNDEEFFTLTTYPTASPPTPALSPTLTPAETAERIAILFTPTELAEHTPTREYIEQHRRR